MKTCLKEKELRRIAVKTGDYLISQNRVQAGSEVLVYASRLIRAEVEKEHGLR